jgi:hypothetical protein
MAGSNKAIKCGVIAEELNDVEVLYEYTGKLMPANRFSFAHFVGHGCGALRRKCRAWAENLLKRGCQCLVLVHDLDEENEGRLRQELEARIRPVGIKPVVVLIPVEELEAWLLADPEAIRITFNMRRTPRIPANPERIHSPKEYLGRIVSKLSKSEYLNTLHNRKIAANQRLTTLDRCPSFARYPVFIRNAGGKGTGVTRPNAPEGGLRRKPRRRSRR